MGQNCRMHIPLKIIGFVALTGALLSGSAWAEPAYALWGSPKYPADFAHFDYVHAQAHRAGRCAW